MELRSTQLVFVVMATVLCLAAASKPRYRRRCRSGEEYFSLNTRNCVPCSVCTENTHPHRQCYGTQDTLCKPFGKFEFRQSETGAEFPAEEPKKTTQAPKPVEEKKRPEPEMSGEQTAATLLLADDTSGEQWFTITLVLAGILVVACLALVILLLVSCYMCKRKQREVLYDSAFAGALLGDDSSPQGKMQLFKIVTET